MKKPKTYSREEEDRLFDLILDQGRQRWEFFNKGKKMSKKESDKLITLCGEMISLVSGTYEKLNFNRKMKVNDTVKNKISGMEGTILKTYSNFKSLAKDKNQFVSMKPSEWLAQQETKFTEAELTEKWAFVLVEGGGAFLSCFSRLQQP